MEKSAEEFVDRLLRPEVHEQPCDADKPGEEAMQLPPWFDEKLYNKGRQFYWEHCFSFTSAALLGLVAVFAVPSILRVLVGSRRSCSMYTAYKRYLSTTLHFNAWFENDLKPGTRSWKSLHAVRSRHYRAGMASTLKGEGKISQRDIALTQFGFFGFGMLKPERMGINQSSPGEWEAFNHFWRTIGYMIGLDDRYNICRSTFEETREVCQQLLDRVYTPCLENVPEHFEHMARVMIEGLWSVNPTLETGAILYYTRYLADVPGYVYTDEERLRLQKKLRAHLKDGHEDTGVDSRLLMRKPELEGLPARPPRLLFLRDYDTLDSAPPYKLLSSSSRYSLALIWLLYTLNNFFYAKLYFNLNYRWSLILMKYCPYLAFFRYGIRKSYVNIFREDPVDETVPKTNEEYYKEDEKGTKKRAWYWILFSWFW